MHGLACPENPLKAPAGCRYALMGNEAIARGVVEAGASVVTGYPGTPSSEVIETLQKLGDGLDIYVEWAVNERVAFEIAYGAAIGGARAMATMKAPGANVAADPMISAAYGGVDGGLVVLIADDPGPHTTQTEQDNRWFAELAKLPMITPSTPQEAKDFTVKGFELSEILGLPVLLRTTTRVNHAVGDVVTGPTREPVRFKRFVRQPERFVRAGMAWNLERHRWLNRTLAQTEDAAEKLGLNMVEGGENAELCIVTEGAAYNYVVEALERLGALERVRIVKLGLLYPAPRKLLSSQLSQCRRVLVVEELDPYVEHVVKRVAFDEGLRIEVLGKDEGLLPLEGELDTAKVLAALAKLLDAEPPAVESASPRREAPPRPPPLCPGCPHRSSYLAIILGIRRAGYRVDEVPIFGDIGCYALSVYPPLNAIWTEHSMGASISMAMGLKLSGYPKPVVATIGDSTFFHAGIQPLIEAVHKRVDMLVVILDNDVVAMTGHQSTPAWTRTETGRPARPVNLVDIVKAIGVDNLAVVDPYDVDGMARVVAEFLRKPGVNVIIAKHPCALLEARLKGVEKVYTVVPEKCTSCMACVKVTGCPALYVTEDGKVGIVEEDCTGCGLCARFCPYGAIVEKPAGRR
ncbi:indolepyruvate oxidoreductase subunit [Hyperthermus butylicus DSM 5456]|uniref:Indolepyruvate oxidoreductase subunit IorA n=2 Tax=Hyperthermus butylicus TaxID=54248 RepID=A2BMR8_HYPBU|nr:indolepyruvate ferredoxin oxidoreductase subunit alpha [Hyperthermus butylicus]ABM81279.1 indolepyruvate oxidoreductase subunit [Hyperthermus butylicus DSM 5456]